MPGDGRDRRDGRIPDAVRLNQENHLMRPGQQNNKRMRGRNRKGPNPLTRSYESNGGDVKIRGTALHIAEKYVQLARDAQASGDRVAAENYLQHAEHYYRILAAAQAQMPQPQPVFRSDEEDDEGEERQDRGPFNGGAGNGGNNGNIPAERGERQGFQGGPQPAFLAGSGEGQSGGEDEDDEPIGDNRFETRPQPQYSEPSERSFHNNNGNNGGGGQSRQQAGGQNEPREGGNYRGRRRRPYRERFGDRERAAGEGGQPAVAEAPPGDD
jgi:hypothetical protein